MAIAFDCKDNKDIPKIVCDTSRVFQNAMKMLHDSKDPLVILPGLEIVRTTKVDAEERSENKSLLGRVAHYLRTHELNVRFADLLDKSDFLNVLNNFDQSANSISGEISNDIAGKMSQGENFLILFL